MLKKWGLFKWSRKQNPTKHNTTQQNRTQPNIADTGVNHMHFCCSLYVFLLQHTSIFGLSLSSRMAVFSFLFQFGWHLLSSNNLYVCIWCAVCVCVSVCSNISALSCYCWASFSPVLDISITLNAVKTGSTLEPFVAKTNKTPICLQLDQRYKLFFYFFFFEK